LFLEKLKYNQKNMTEPIKKEGVKETLAEALGPFDERFNKIETTLIAIVEDLKEARKERQNLEKSINETYNAVDGFIKIVDKLDQEFTLMKEDVRKIKEVIKEKLGVNLD